jgi:hypothetical protein
MTPMSARNKTGNGMNPNNFPATGVKGGAIAATIVSRAAINKYFPGVLLKKGPRLRIRSTTTETVYHVGVLQAGEMRVTVDGV